MLPHYHSFFFSKNSSYRSKQKRKLPTPFYGSRE
nr:MAG TPA: hypothetical protein [Caudoviricetes sp.]